MSLIGIRLNFVRHFVAIINYNVKALSMGRFKQGKKNVCIDFKCNASIYSANTFYVLLGTAPTACT
jgi:hypothetical protein